MRAPGKARTALGTTWPASTHERRAGTAGRSSPALGLDVVDVGMLARLDRGDDLADVDAILDHRIAHLQFLEGNLVSERDVLRAAQIDRPVLVEDQPGQRLSGLDAFDDDHGDRIVGVMQHTVDQCGISCFEWTRGDTGSSAAAGSNIAYCAAYSPS